MSGNPTAAAGPSEHNLLPQAALPPPNKKWSWDNNDEKCMLTYADGKEVNNKTKTQKNNTETRGSEAASRKRRGRVGVRVEKEAGIWHIC